MDKDGLKTDSRLQCASMEKLEPHRSKANVSVPGNLSKARIRKYGTRYCQTVNMRLKWLKIVQIFRRERVNPRQKRESLTALNGATYNSGQIYACP
jgi:hypothetical protein